MSKAPQRNIRILLVEDVEELRQSLAEILTKHGYEVIQASGGNEAWEICRKSLPIDLLLTDLIMPEVGGFELASKMRRRFPELKVLFMSGNVLQNQGEQEDLLANDPQYLQKPFETQVMLAKIENLTA